MFPRRAGLIIWVSDTKFVKNLERIGNVLYASRRLKYVILYLNESKLKDTIPYLEKLHFVKKVERSHRASIRTDYSNKNLV